jgi:hypothetical protein
LGRKAEIILDYQNYIETPPVSTDRLYSQACASDAITLTSWEAIWLKNMKENRATLGPFEKVGIGQLFGSQKYRPVIIAGSGPSLKVNAHLLKDRGDIALISCLHNFHFLEEVGARPDYYVSLDAGPVVLEEVSEGGSKSADEYWAMTKDRTLIAYTGSHPDLFKKWQGKIYVFSAVVPKDSFLESAREIDAFETYLSTGGNVLGACFYLAKAIMGANPIAFVGADFCFSYERKFHAWDSKYDASLGYVVKAIDVYGNKVLSWQSYQNFKAWFDCMAVKVPGLYVNCSEGGTLGAYAEGNIMAIRQMELEKFIAMYHMHEDVRFQCENPGAKDPKNRTILF